jgi:hypothetical protein
VRPKQVRVGFEAGSGWIWSNQDRMEIHAAAQEMPSDASSGDQHLSADAIE